jgi:hypothetical protein
MLVLLIKGISETYCLDRLRYNDIQSFGLVQEFESCWGVYTYSNVIS